MSRSLIDLHPDVIPAAQAFIYELVKRGIPHVVTCTLRTLDEQVAYYAQGGEPLEYVNKLRAKANMPPIGAAESTYTVTQCDGMKHKSAHQSGRALDVVPADANGRPVWPPPYDPRWKAIAEVGKAAGFQWGGDWTDFIDSPHFQMP